MVEYQRFVLPASDCLEGTALLDKVCPHSCAKVFGNVAAERSHLALPLPKFVKARGSLTLDFSYIESATSPDSLNFLEAAGRQLAVNRAISQL